MNIVSLTSVTGGAGCSTIAANLAGMLCRLGREVLVLEWNPGRSLPLYLDMMHQSLPTMVAALTYHANPPHPTTEQPDPTTALAMLPVSCTSREGVQFIAFCDDQQYQDLSQFETLLLQNPRLMTRWLPQLLRQLALPDDAIVLIDAGRMPSMYVQQTLSIAQHHWVILAADPINLLRAPSLQQRLAHPQRQVRFILNQFDPLKVLQRDIHTMLKAKLGDLLFSNVVHRDQAIPEACASGEAFYQFAPHSQAVDDLYALANWIQLQ